MLITKNGTTLSVSKGAFRTMFKPQGWKIVKDSRKALAQETPESPKPAKAESPKKSLADIQEGKPLSEMTLDELIEFADDNSIDISGVKGKQNIKKVIVEAMK